MHSLISDSDIIKIGVELIKQGAEIQEATEHRGGARSGAGRPVGAVHREKYWRARGINPLAAAEIMARATHELKTWKRILSSEDDRIVLQAMMFLTTMRDGKPAQSINISQQTISVQLKDIESARAIIKEIRQGLAMSPQPMLAESNTSQCDTPEEGEYVSQGDTMLSEDEGGISGGLG